MEDSCVPSVGRILCVRRDSAVIRAISSVQVVRIEKADVYIGWSDAIPCSLMAENDGLERGWFVLKDLP